MATWNDVLNYLFRIQMQYRSDYLGMTLSESQQTIASLAARGEAPLIELEQELQVDDRNRGTVGVSGQRQAGDSRVCQFSLGDDGEWLRFEAVIGTPRNAEFIDSANYVASLGRGGLIANQAGEIVFRNAVHLPSVVDLTLLFDCLLFTVETVSTLRADLEAAQERDAEESRALFSSFGDFYKNPPATPASQGDEGTPQVSDR